MTSIKRVAGSTARKLAFAAARTLGTHGGRMNASHAEGLEGLEAGERVILHPSERVGDGTAVVERAGAADDG